MKNTLLFLSLLLSTVSVFAAGGATVAVAIKPSIVRDDPVPQVFVDGGGTYYISTESTDSYNRVMNSLNTSLQNHKAASYQVDPKNNMIIDVTGAVKAESISVYEDDTSSSSSSAASSSPASSPSSALGKMPTNTGASAVPGAGLNTGATPSNH